MNTFLRSMLIVVTAVLIAWLGNMAVSSQSFTVFERGFAAEMHDREGGHEHRDHHAGAEGGVAGELIKSVVVVSAVGAVTVAGSLVSRRRKRFKHRA